MTAAGRPGELGHMDAIGAVGRAAAPLHAGRRCSSFHSLTRMVTQATGVQPLGQRRHLVIMRGEQRARFVSSAKMLGRRPGDGEPVEGRGAAPDLVEDDQAPFGRLIEDGGGLHHLDHEGGAAARQIVCRADAAEQPVHHADMRGFRRHETRPSAPGSRSARSGAGRSICPPCWAR